MRVEERLELNGGGILKLRTAGGNVHLEAVRSRSNDGLYKVRLIGPGGRTVLLGTLVPEGERLVLRRILSRGELEQAGCWPVTGGEVFQAYSFAAARGWYRETHPERLMSDPVARAALREPMLCRKTEAGFCLASPFRTDHPVMLSALFCLAVPELVEGTIYLVWQFRKDGSPAAANKEKFSGQTMNRRGNNDANS